MGVRDPPLYMRGFGKGYAKDPLRRARSDILVCYTVYRSPDTIRHRPGTDGPPDVPGIYYWASERRSGRQGDDGAVDRFPVVPRPVLSGNGLPARHSDSVLCGHPNLCYRRHLAHLSRSALRVPFQLPPAEGPDTGGGGLLRVARRKCRRREDRTFRTVGMGRHSRDIRRSETGGGRNSSGGADGPLPCPYSGRVLPHRAFRLRPRYLKLTLLLQQAHLSPLSPIFSMRYPVLLTSTAPHSGQYESVPSSARMFPT